MFEDEEEEIEGFKLKPRFEIKYLIQDKPGSPHFVLLNGKSEPQVGSKITLGIETLQRELGEDKTEWLRNRIIGEDNSELSSDEEVELKQLVSSHWRTLESIVYGYELLSLFEIWNLVPPTEDNLSKLGFNEVRGVGALTQ